MLLLVRQAPVTLLFCSSNKFRNFNIQMRRSTKIFAIFLILFGIIASDCAYRRDCGGRRKKKIKTNMGGYM